MPRPEATHKKAEGSRTGPSGKPFGGSRSDDRKRGFQVGPKNAGRDAYLGKAKKIKEDLIMNAKIKKQFAKTLKDEGLDSSRLGTGSRRAGERDDGYTGKGKRRAAEAEAEAIVEAPSAPPRARALSPLPLASESTTSLRTVKRDAFAKHHPSRVGTAPYSKARPLKVDQRRSKGQPNMGARMGALLEQLQREKK